MPTVRKPRAGSMQFWPRVRSKRSTPRIRSYAESKDVKLTGFLGYKAGMTHVQTTETSKHSHLKGQEVSFPVTIIECPPVKIASLRLYKKDGVDLKLKTEIILASKDKNLEKRMSLPKKAHTLEKINPEKYDDARVLVYSQPAATGIGKKMPDMAEIGIGGTEVKDKIEFVKSNIGKEISIDSVFADGTMLDLKSFTKGKGFQGPLKRFGIHIRQAKSEKSIRNPGSLGAWRGQGQVMWRVAHAGKMGYHQRTEYNKQLFKIVKPEEIKFKGGIIRYGNVKTAAALVKGGVAGAKKRLVVMQLAVRSNKKQSLPTIEKISLHEMQGI